MKNLTEQKRHCCKIGCKKEAEYTIYENRSRQDEGTESCLEHISDLMPCGDHINIDRITKYQMKEEF